MQSDSRRRVVHGLSFLVTPLSLLSLCVAVALTSPQVHAQDEKPAERRHAILVGINEYDHADLQTLRYAQNDATAMGDVLAAAGYQVTLLTQATGKAKPELLPRKANIEKQIQQILNGVTKRDTVILGLAGHGLQFLGSDDFYFCPADAKPFANRTETLVSLRKLYTLLEESGAGVKVLMVDACRDDPKTSRSAGIDADTVRPPKGVAALFSCAKGERAYEHESLKHGVFFHHVLDGLKGAAKDADGEITFESLANHVKKRVATSVPKLIGGGAQQSPTMIAELGGIPPVLVTVRFLDVDEDLRLVEDSRLNDSITRLLKQKAPSRLSRWRDAMAAGSVAGTVLFAKCCQLGIETTNDADEAARLLQKAANSGSSLAQLELAYCYQSGTGVPQDAASAARQFQQLVTSDSRPVRAMAMASLGAQMVVGSGVTKNETEGLNWVRKSADLGATFALRRLAVYYEYGMAGIEKNLVESRAWYLKAADAGDSFAMVQVGSAFSNADPPDIDRAKSWYQKAIDVGDPSGLFYMGMLYRYGRKNHPPNLSVAMEWYKKSAEAGHRVGMESYAEMLMSGEGVEKNEREGFRWFLNAADAGYSAAMKSVGNCLRNGTGVEKNEAEAFRWYEKMANSTGSASGRAEGMNMVGFCHLNGVGVPKNPEKAFEWFTKAAVGEYKKAYYNLGYCHETGSGTPKNIPEAIKWYRKAANELDADAKARLEVLDPKPITNSNSGDL